MKKSPTAVAYCRVASVEQSKDRHIANQKAEIKKFARDYNIKITKWFVDIGSSEDDQPGFVDAFIHIVKANRAGNPLSYIIAADPTRFSRNPRTYYQLVDALESENVEVIFANGQTLPGNSSHVDRFQELIAVSMGSVHK